MSDTLKPRDEGLHPPGYHRIATVQGGIVATSNGTAYWLDDNGTQTALDRLPKKRLAELVVSEARLVAQLRDGLAAVLEMGTKKNGNGAPAQELGT